jgi:hypothetical protein
MQHVGAIEATIGKRHRKCAAFLQGDALVKPDPSAQRVAGFDVFSGEIYTGDPTPVSTGDETRCASDPAANVENVHLRSEPELIEKFLGRLASADVELIDGGQIIDRDIVWRFAKAHDARAYHLDEYTMGIVP